MKNTLDYKDILCMILKRAGCVVLTAAVFAAAFAAYKYMSGRGTSPVVIVNKLDPDTRLAGESDEAYANRVRYITQANNLMNSIDIVTGRVEALNDYMENSILVNLDPVNTAHSRAQVLIEADDEVSYRSLYSAYEIDIESGAYLTEAASELGVSPEALRELIDVGNTLDYYPTTSDNLIFNSGVESADPMIITVRGESVEFTDMIMDRIIDEIDSYSASLADSLGSHSVSVVDRRSDVSNDTDVRRYQYDTAYQLGILQERINSQNTSLDNLAKSMGLPSRESFYLAAQVNTAGDSGVSTKSVVIFGLAGFVIGAMVALGFLTGKYLWGKKIISQTQFFCLHPDVEKIGVCKPLGKRSKFFVLLDRMTGDDDDLTEENNRSIIACNYDNLTGAAGNILITGLADEDTAKKLVKDLGLKGDLKLDMFSNPDVLKKAGEYDGIVLLEQRGVSSRRYVAEEISLLKNSGTGIVGAVII